MIFAQRFSAPAIAIALAVGFSGNHLLADNISVQIDSSTDDAEEHLTEGNTIDLTSTDLELASEGGGSDTQLIGLRFNNVNIPAMATINSASVQFHVDETDAEPTSVNIFGELNANPVTYSSTAGDISARARTLAEVAWDDIPAWNTVNEEGPDQQTPDLASIIQEIVNQGGWNSGNSLALMIEETSISGERTAESFDGEAGSAPILLVDFTEFVAVPEPASIAIWSLLGIALAGFGYFRMRKKK